MTRGEIGEAAIAVSDRIGGRLSDPDPTYHGHIENLLELLSGFPTNPRHFYSSRVVSPMDLVQRERLLRLIAPELELGEPSPCDARVWGYDEPPDRSVTKVGGLPYWPDDRPWPLATNGSPMEFLVQFNFNGSHDLLPDLPAEMLCVFVNFDDDLNWQFSCEWQFTGTAASLIEQPQLPKIDRPIVASPAFAVAFRIDDFPHAQPLVQQPSFGSWESIATIHGSKIGGTPAGFSGPPPTERRGFLCSLHSLRHPTNIPWPFINVEEPLTPQMLGGIGCQGGRGCHDTVSFPDEGALYFYLHENGKLRILLQSWNFQEWVF